MASQGERVPGGLDMCSNNLESMARDGTPFYNFNSRGSSTPYSEHGLCRQKESHNGGAIVPRRGTEQAAILSATNGTTRGECSQQPPLQTTWAWQADIGRLCEELREEWRTELEKQTRKHELEVKQLTEEWETKLEEQKRKHNLEVKKTEGGGRRRQSRKRKPGTEDVKRGRRMEKKVGRKRM